MTRKTLGSGGDGAEKRKHGGYKNRNPHGHISHIRLFIFVVVYLRNFRVSETNGSQNLRA